MGKNDRRNNRPKNRNNGARYEKNEFRRFESRESAAEIAENENAIREFKARKNICPVCGEPIADMAEAMTDKKSGQPAHFDCVLGKVKAVENLRDGQQVAYIGQGRFAVVAYENSREKKRFKIEKIIEWEEKGKPVSWRGEMADLYSKVK